LQLSKSSIYSTKPLAQINKFCLTLIFAAAAVAARNTYDNKGWRVWPLANSQSMDGLWDD
ncbi:hypothetical protein, partial [Citrobacter freundii]|uniref:hypothetical protein n=1 Tax=Citrobacter freundii TaxID=546 RepID=UPI0006691936